MSKGDFLAGASLHVQFTTYGYAGPQTLVGGSVVAYRAGETTPISTGITLTADFGGVTGLHLITVDTAGYQAGKDYNLVLATGTVDGETRAGAFLESFSIELESALRPSSIADIVTAVWSYGTRTLTSLGTVVADTAAEVWNALASAFNTAGTMGEKLNAAASGGDDPWAVPVPGSYPAGSAGEVLGNLESSIVGGLSATDITLTSPLLEGGVLELVAGDAYDLDHDRALDEWAFPGQPSLVGAMVFFVIDGVLSVEALSVGGAGTETQIPVFELTAEDTATLTRVGERTYRYQVQAVWVADVPEQPAVLTRGDVTVVDRAVP